MVEARRGGVTRKALVDDVAERPLGLDAAPDLPIEHESEPLVTVVGAEQAQLVLQGVAGRQVADVVEQCSQSDEPLLGRVEAHVELPLPFEPVGIGFALAAVALERLDHQLGDVTGAQGMLEAGVGCASIDDIGLPELVHESQPLEGWVVHNRELVIVQPDKAVDGDEELLEGAGRGGRCAAVGLRDREAERLLGRGLVGGSWHCGHLWAHVRGRISSAPDSERGERILPQHDALANSTEGDRTAPLGPVNAVDRAPGESQMAEQAVTGLWVQTKHRGPIAPLGVMEALALVSNPAKRIDESYVDHFRDLVRLCRALGAGAEAEDIAQEALVYAREHVGELRDPSALRPWVRQIARRAALRHLQRRPVGIGQPAFVFVPEDVSLGLDLAQAIARLPQRERQAISLVYGLGYTQQEAAEVLGIARGTIAATLFHARRRLGDLLASTENR